MSEHIEIDLYQFISGELEKMERRLNKHSEDMEARLDKRFEAVDKRFTEVDKRFKDMEVCLNKRIDDTEARFDKRFDKLEEEVRWPRRIAIGGVITTVIAVLFAIIGWQGVLTA